MVLLEAVEHITRIKEINSLETKSSFLQLKINLGQRTAEQKELIDSLTPCTSITNQRFVKVILLTLLTSLTFLRDIWDVRRTLL